MSEEKKEVLERIAKNFADTEDSDTKSFTIMLMTAYQSGKEAGIASERKEWEEKLSNVNK